MDHSRNAERPSLAAPYAPVNPVSWYTVTETHERVLIVATGPSVESVPLPKFEQAHRSGVHILAVNGAITWLPVVSSWFTVDPGPRNRILMAARYSNVDYYAAVPLDYGTPNARVLYHRPVAEHGVRYLKRVEGEGPLRIRKCLSEKADSIHTGNSAWGALGLAYLMKAKKVALLGVDAKQSRYAYQPGKPALTFRHLPMLFQSSVQQLNSRGVRVVNGSLHSLVTCYERMLPEKAVEWLIND